MFGDSQSIEECDMLFEHRKGGGEGKQLSWLPIHYILQLSMPTLQRKR